MKIKDIDYDAYKTRGCETCDYGASYIDNIKIVWEDDSYIRFVSETSYKEMSESDWMILLANTSNKDEIIKAWKNKYRHYVNDDSVYYETGYTYSNESTRYEIEGDSDEK